MTLPMATAMIVERCDRCGLLFPHTQPSEIGRAFCEPCRDALWRDEQGARADQSAD